MYMFERRRRDNINRAFMSYVADSLQNIPQNKYFTKRFEDLLVTHEEIDADKVISHVIQSCGLEVVNNEPA